MSRAQQNPTGRLRLAGLGLVVALGAVGCSAGQITQTDGMLPAVNGTQGQAGPIAVRDVALYYPHGSHYAKGADAPLTLTIVNTGATADQLIEVLSPVADGKVELTGDVNLPGGTILTVGEPGKEAPGTAHGESSHAATTPAPTSGPQPTSAAHSSSEAHSPSSASSAPGSPSTTGSATPSQPSSAAPTSAASSSAKPALGKLRIVLAGLNADLYPGRTIPVTFVFAKAGSVTVQVPIASPTAPRSEEAHEEGGH